MRKTGLTLASSARPTRQNISMISQAICTAIAITTISSASIFGATPVQAQALDPVQAASGKTRINRSAHLVSMTELLASASCRINAGIGTDAAKEDLVYAHDAIASTIDGLLNGNEALGMPGAETRAATIRALRDADAAWTPLNVAAENMLAGTGTAADAAVISNGYANLFEQNDVLAAAISGEYTNPQDLLQSDSTALTFANRTEMLAERMTRAMCELATGTAQADAQQDLQQAVDQFQQILIALRDGFSGAGLNPPPNDAVRESLVATYALWTEKRGLFDVALAGETPSNDTVAAAGAFSKELLLAMEETIALYTEAFSG